MHRYVIGAMFALAFQSAFAETILICTHEEGRSFYPEQKGGENKTTGWREERIKGEQIRLDKKDGGYDLLFGDGKSALTSSIDQGATVADLSHEEESATFLVLYPNQAIETYYFYETPNETPALLLNQVRFNEAVCVSAISRYTCKRKSDEELERRSELTR